MHLTTLMSLFGKKKIDEKEEAIVEIREKWDTIYEERKEIEER